MGMHIVVTLWHSSCCMPRISCAIHIHTLACTMHTLYAIIVPYMNMHWHIYCYTLCISYAMLPYRIIVTLRLHYHWHIYCLMLPYGNGTRYAYAIHMPGFTMKCLHRVPAIGHITHVYIFLH